MAEYTQRWTNVCWTLFDVTEEQYAVLRALVPETAKYCVFGRETCPDTGKKHLQGYVELLAQTRVSKLRKLFLVPKDGQSFHCEKRMGSAVQAATYCKKDNDFEEFGVTPTDDDVPGKRNDLLAVKDMLDKGVALSEIAQAHFGSWVRYNKAFASYRQMMLPKREHVTISIVLYGASDAGKTHWASTYFGQKPYFVKKGNHGVWWDDYDQEPVVVFDEFSGWLQFTTFKTLIDGTPLSVDAKGGYRNFTSKIVVFCSNNAPEDWWSQDVFRTENDRKAMTRRLHFVFEAVARKDLLGNLLGHTMRMKRCFLPHGAHVEHNWCIQGLSHDESMLWLDPSTDKAVLDAMKVKVDNRMLDTGGGVIILPPPWDPTLDFFTAVSNVMNFCLGTREVLEAPPLPAIPEQSAPASPLQVKFQTGEEENPLDSSIPYVPAKPNGVDNLHNMVDTRGVDVPLPDLAINVFAGDRTKPHIVVKHKKAKKGDKPFKRGEAWEKEQAAKRARRVYIEDEAVEDNV